MTQLIRSLATSINALAGAHFCAPRRRARLPLRLALVNSNTHIPEPQTATFDGYTSDISASGMAILLPAASFSDLIINQGNRTMRIVLELVTGPVEAEASLVRYEPAQSNNEASEQGCLIGAQIVNMPAAHRERFIQHLRSID